MAKKKSKGKTASAKVVSKPETKQEQVKESRENVFDKISLAESLSIKLRERQEQAYKENMLVIDKEYNERASQIEKQLCAIGENDNISWQDTLFRSIVAKYIVAQVVTYNEDNFHGYFEDFVAGIEKTFNCDMQEQVKILLDFEALAEKVPQARKVLKSFLGHMHGGYHFAPKKNIHKSKVYTELWQAL